MNERVPIKGCLYWGYGKMDPVGSILIMLRPWMGYDYCSDPQARSDPNGESEPKPEDARFISFILRVIKFSFSKMSRPESLARPEWRIRTGARFTPMFSFILSKHFINSFSCERGFSFGQAHNHL